MGGYSCFRLDLDFFHSVVQQPDSDVIEAEVLLNLTRDLAKHMDRVITGDGGARDIVEKSQLPRAALLFGEKPGIFNRDRNLSSSGDENVQIALLENEFAFRIHRDHDS